MDYVDPWEVQQRLATQDLSQRWTIGGTAMAPSIGKPSRIGARQPVTNTTTYLDDIELGASFVNTESHPDWMENGGQSATTSGQSSGAGSSSNYP